MRRHRRQYTRFAAGVLFIGSTVENGNIPHVPDMTDVSAMLDPFEAGKKEGAVPHTLQISRVPRCPHGLRTSCEQHLLACVGDNNAGMVLPVAS